MRIESALAPSPFAFPELGNGPGRAEREHAHEVHRAERGHGRHRGVGQGEEHGRREGLRRVKHDLKDLAKTAHRELRDLARGADLDEDARRELRSLEKDFRHELKDAFRDARRTGGAEGAAELSGRVEAAVDGLLAGVREAVGAPAPERAPASTTVVARELTVTVTRGGHGETAPTAAAADPAGAAGAVGESDASAGSTAAAPGAESPAAAPSADRVLSQVVFTRLELDVSVQHADGSFARLTASAEQMLAVYRTLGQQIEATAGDASAGAADAEAPRLEAAA